MNNHLAHAGWGLIALSFVVTHLQYFQALAVLLGMVASIGSLVASYIKIRNRKD